MDVEGRDVVRQTEYILKYVGEIGVASGQTLISF